MTGKTITTLAKILTADPVHIEITLAGNGSWNWDVVYEKENSGLSQTGRNDTLDEAMDDVRDVILNGRTEP